MKDRKFFEIAEGVYWLRLGLVSGNVYFVRSGSSWVLIDTAFSHRDLLIRKSAEALFGVGARPSAILLTHVHPDHSGSALDLARAWNCPVYVHPDELPLAIVRDLSTVKQFANPLDRRIVLPLLRLLPRRRVIAMLSKESLEGAARPLDPDSSVPGLPEWRSITTTGHSPGHVVFFREVDRVLISGDALMTVDMGSFRGFWSWLLHPNKPRISKPPWYTNWDEQMVKSSIVALSQLRPRVVASGHGVPMADDETANLLCAYALTLHFNPEPPEKK